jgi:hypothetical protein
MRPALLDLTRKDHVMPSSTRSVTRARRSSSLRLFLTPSKFRRPAAAPGTASATSSASAVPEHVHAEGPACPVWFDTTSPQDAPRSAAARVARARKIAERLLDPAIATATAVAAAAGGDVRGGSVPAFVGVRSVECVRLDELIAAAVARVAAVTLRYGDRSVQQSDVADRWARIIGARVRVLAGGAA